MTTDFETLLKFAGGFGVWQLRLLAFISLNQIFQAFQHLGSMFLAATPEHWCQVPGLPKNLSLSEELIKEVTIPREIRHGKYRFSQCKYYARDYSTLFENNDDFDTIINSNESVVPITSCSAWNYDTSQYTSTIVTEWNLVCSSKWLMSTVQASYMGGVLVGCLIFGFVSDRWGRRRGMLVAQVIFTSAAIATAFAPHYMAFIVGRFLVAVAAPGIAGCSFCLITEIASTKWRALVGLTIQIPFGLGYAALPGLAYLIRDWMYLQLAMSVPSVILLLSFWFVPESPRWLITQNRYKEAIEILHKCADANGRQLPSDEEMKLMMKRFKKQEEDDKKKKTLACWKLVGQLCSNRKMVKLTVTAYFTWFVVALVYYGLALNSPMLGGNQYVVVFLGGIFEVPAYVIGFLIVNKIGRRVSYSTTFLVAGAVCIFLVLTPADMAWLTSTLAVLGKFIITITFGISYLYTAELFPTTIRNIAICYGSVCGRIGSISAPYIVYLLTTYHESISLILFGLLSTIAGLISLLLPETKEKHLSETVGELEHSDELTENGDVPAKESAQNLNTKV